MKQETIEKLKELSKIKIVEKDDKIVFVVLKGEKDNGRINKKKRTN